MKTAILSLAFLWQLPSTTHVQDTAGRYFHYEREVLLPADVAGQACAALDETIFAHASTSAPNDLRLFVSTPFHPEVEIPFAMVVSSVQPAEATVGNAAIQNGHLIFDLAMPSGPYSSIDLQLKAKNFLGAAQVWGLEESNSPVPLGVYAIFDRSDQEQEHFTSLLLRRALNFRELHFDLRLTDFTGHVLPNLSSSVITGARVQIGNLSPVPYTTVAVSSSMQPEELWSQTTFTLPAHVPVERVSFVLDPKFSQSFIRDVSVIASPSGMGSQEIGAAESIDGQIFRVARPAQSGMPAINMQHLEVDATLGSNLRSPAKVMVAIHNGSNTPLPVQRVELQMRQRQICFEARAGASYILRYGDATLHAPSYAYARNFRLAAAPINAILQPEIENRHFVTRPVVEIDERHTLTTKMTILLVLLAIGGVVALQYVRYKQGEL